MGICNGHQKEKMSNYVSMIELIYKEQNGF